MKKHQYKKMLQMLLDENERLETEKSDAVSRRKFLEDEVSRLIAQRFELEKKINDLQHEKDSGFVSAFVAYEQVQAPDPEQNELQAEKALEEENFYRLHIRSEGSTFNEINERITEKQSKKIKLMLDMEDFVRENCPEWEADWSDDKQDKYGIVCYQHELIADGNYYCSNYLVFGISVPNSSLAEQMLEKFRDRIEEVY